MSLEDLIPIPVWDRYSKKLTEKILRPRSAGIFTEEEANARAMRGIRGQAGSFEEGQLICLYWLVDEMDGIIVDCKFQVFGPSALIAAAETTCDLLIGKNYDQAKRLGGDLIDKQLRDAPEEPAFPDETKPLLNLVLEAIEEGAAACRGIPLAPAYVTPLPHQDREEKGEGYPGWPELSYDKKLAVIETILNEEVRPYVELDAGGIEIVRLTDQHELIIAYKGSCTSCFSAVGTTLSTIQNILQMKVWPELTVIPDMSTLTLSG